MPENWRPVLSLEENLEAGSASLDLPDNMVPVGLDSTQSLPQRSNRVAYCDKCRNGKPPRCHHCSVCKTDLILSSISLLAL